MYMFLYKVELSHQSIANWFVDVELPLLPLAFIFLVLSVAPIIYYVF